MLHDDAASISLYDPSQLVHRFLHTAVVQLLLLLYSLKTTGYDCHAEQARLWNKYITTSCTHSIYKLSLGYLTALDLISHPHIPPVICHTHLLWFHLI